MRLVGWKWNNKWDINQGVWNRNEVQMVHRSNKRFLPIMTHTRLQQRVWIHRSVMKQTQRDNRRLHFSVNPDKVLAGLVWLSHCTLITSKVFWMVMWCWKWRANQTWNNKHISIISSQLKPPFLFRHLMSFALPNSGKEQFTAILNFMWV